MGKREQSTEKKEEAASMASTSSLVPWGLGVTVFSCFISVYNSLIEVSFPWLLVLVARSLFGLRRADLAAYLALTGRRF